jgi:hypothetical protein
MSKGKYKKVYPWVKKKSDKKDTLSGCLPYKYLWKDECTI